MSKNNFLGIPYSYLDGLAVITSWTITKKSDPIKTKRTWKERLFTKPWMPLVKSKWIVTDIPDLNTYYRMPGKIIMHPAALDGFKKSLNEYNRHAGAEGEK
jgi:hypothetical protein